MATAECSRFAGILSAALSQHHLLGFERAQLEFHHYCHFINYFLFCNSFVDFVLLFLSWFVIVLGVEVIRLYIDSFFFFFLFFPSNQFYLKYDVRFTFLYIHFISLRKFPINPSFRGKFSLGMCFRFLKYLFMSIYIVMFFPIKYVNRIITLMHLMLS